MKYNSGKYILLKEPTFKIYNEFSFAKIFEYGIYFDFELKQEDYSMHDIKIFLRYKYIENDGYEITINDNIVISASNINGLKYGLKSLNKLILKKDKWYMLPQIEMIDAPSFSKRGIVEGFYGKPYSFSERIELFDIMEKYNMNTYFYAPKDDLKLRHNWRVKYSVDELKKFKELIEECTKKNIEFVYCISPGNDIVFTNDDDFKKITGKLQQLIDIGCYSYGIFWDDIDYELNPVDKTKLHSSAYAQTEYSNRINKFLKEKLSNSELYFCPTEYWVNYKTKYNIEVAGNIDSDIIIFWTGYKVLANKITEKDVRCWNEMYKNRIVIWDNIPVNDSQCNINQIFISPYMNRYENMEKYNHIGLVSNPMIQFEASKIPIINMAYFMWNSNNFESEKIFEKAVSEYSLEVKQEIIKLSELLVNIYLQEDINWKLKILVLDNNVLKIIEKYKEYDIAFESLKSKGIKLYDDLKMQHEQLKKQLFVLENIEDESLINKYIEENENYLQYDIILELNDARKKQ